MDCSGGLRVREGKVSKREDGGLKKKQATADPRLDKKTRNFQVPSAGQIKQVCREMLLQGLVLFGRLYDQHG